MELSRSFHIGNRIVGTGAPCFVIAEAGVAHFGDFQKAIGLVDLAVEAKADAVKFQIFDVDAMIVRANVEWRERLGSRALKREQFRELKDYCDQKGIIFFATAHDEPSFDYLASLDPPVFKIGSGELKNWGYLRRIASEGKPIIFSTGMYNLDDVGEGLRHMVGAGNNEIAILQCTTQYPTPPEEVNLRVMETYRERFGGVVGYSDHTSGFHIPLAAVACGAQVIEKHISIDFNVPNAQDWKVSCGPHDLARFISELREVERALGDGNKRQTNVEAESEQWARKSLVTTRAVKAGDRIVADMLVAMRPGTGIAPDQIDKVVGKRVLRDIDANVLLRWDVLQ